MPHSIEHLITDTEKGVKIDLKTMYVYPDGHANLTFSDDTNWPMADPYEVVQIIIRDLLRPMQKRANAKESLSKLIWRQGASPFKRHLTGGGASNLNAIVPTSDCLIRFILPPGHHRTQNGHIASGRTPPT